MKFEGGDGEVLTPATRDHYAIAFGPDGRVNARVSCNRGIGSWSSAAPGQLTFGPMALTRAMCPPDPVQDRLPKHWNAIRSYVIRDGHLFLALMADGGIYEFEPAGTAPGGSTR